ncbi:MAG: MerR family transcriptional regulator [Acidimicrobiia bacterium]
MSTYTVGQLAGSAGISVRTLHHYDDIGLLPASGRTRSGYRTYTNADVDRLYAILAYRELGLGLSEIEAAVNGSAPPQAVLVDARARTENQIVRLEAIHSNLNTAIESLEQGVTMTPEEKLSAFGDFDPDHHAAEAEERWGDTEAFGDASRRTSSYGVDEWKTIRSEADGIYAEFHRLSVADVPADSPEAGRSVEAHRQHITRWFYECTPEIHAGLGAMYESDMRFAETIDKAGTGTATYMSAAIAAHYGS